MCCFADLCLLRRSTPSTSSGYPEHISRKGVPEVTSSWLVPKEEVKEEYIEPIFNKEAKEEGAEEMKKETKEEYFEPVFKKGVQRRGSRGNEKGSQRGGTSRNLKEKSVFNDYV